MKETGGGGCYPNTEMLSAAFLTRRLRQYLQSTLRNRCRYWAVALLERWSFTNRCWSKKITLTESKAAASSASATCWGFDQFICSCCYLLWGIIQVSKKSKWTFLSEAIRPHALWLRTHQSLGLSNNLQVILCCSFVGHISFIHPKAFCYSLRDDPQKYLFHHWQQMKNYNCVAGMQ